MNVILWAVVGLAALVFLISVSVTCSVFAKTFETEMWFEDITRINAYPMYCSKRNIFRRATD